MSTSAPFHRLPTVPATGMLIEHLDDYGTCRVTVKDGTPFPCLVRTVQRADDGWRVTTTAKGIVTSETYEDYCSALDTLTALFMRSVHPHQRRSA